MYAYTIAILLLNGLDVVNSRNLQSTNTSYNHGHHILPHVNATVVQVDGEFAQNPDRCGPVALKCYKPILSYMDNEGEYCGWKKMSTFKELPDVCMDLKLFSLDKWGDNVIKNNYKFLKTCDKIKIYQQCVQNNQVCRRDMLISLVNSQQNIFCNSIEEFLSSAACVNAWDRSDNWDKLMYTYSVIVQACPVTHYRQLSLDTIKLSLFSYITYGSSRIDGFVQSLNAEVAGRLICQYMQQNLCFAKRGDKMCNGFLPMIASQVYNDKMLIDFCSEQIPNVGKCNAFVKMKCPVNLTTGEMTVTMDFQDIRSIYNFTYWRALGKKEVNILLNTVNTGIGHCDVSNLIFKQIGCYHQYMTQIDINHANHGSYLSENMCSNIKYYNSCFEAYINSPCPDMANQFQGIGRFLNLQCGILRIANQNVTCPLHSVYSDIIVSTEAWFRLIMWLIQQYVTVIEGNQMDALPLGWTDAIVNNADSFITYYESILMNGAKSTAAEYYETDIISIGCSQEAADVYEDFGILCTGLEYYQLVNHMIKGAKYIKYIVQ